jgi:hypothetical protein
MLVLGCHLLLLMLLLLTDVTGGARLHTLSFRDPSHWS